MDQQVGVVVGIDGSLPSERALAWAAQAAGRRGIALTIIHAMAAVEVPAPQVTASANEVLTLARQQAERLWPGLLVDGVLVADRPANALIEASRAARMVVVGNRGHGGFHDLLLGSTSVHTAMHAPCPVVIVREPADDVGAETAGRIVVGVDGSPRGAAALAFAFEEAQLTGLGVTAVHAWLGAVPVWPMGVAPFVTDLAEQARLARQMLSDTVGRWQDRYQDVDVRQVTPQMSPAAALVRHSMGAHLVVVGSRGLGGFAGLLLGSTGQALIHHAGCPVAIAHAPAGASP